MDWDKLRIFHAVAEAGSFTSAGEALNLNQSSVSRQISTLEESLDLKLFHRHPRGLVLTEQGEILKSAASDIFSKLSRIEGLLSDTKDLAEGALTITASDFIGSTWISGRLREFREICPNIQLTILFEDRVLNLSMREADAALRLSKSKQSNLIQKKLTSINFHVCASKKYLDKHGRPEKISDFKKHCLIGFPQDSYAPFENANWLFDLAEVDYDQKKQLLMMNSMHAIVESVRTGAGIGTLPDFLIEENDDIEIVMPEQTRPPVDLYFVYPKERQHSKRIMALRDFLVNQLKI